MSSTTNMVHAAPKRTLLQFLRKELKPRGKLLTPFNIITIPIIIAGLIIIVIRFWKGLGTVTNLSQSVPWGLWIGFDVVTGVAFAGGAYVLTFIVYILNVEKYRPIVRVTVLNGFLAYLFYAGALLLDLGRPWNVINPIIGNSFGTSSVLFLVAWHFLLYMLTTLIEFTPAIAEWLGMERLKKIVKSMTVGAVIFGITLSTLHQSGLGALYLMAKGKIHPLWYSEFIPVLFFVSSIFAGLSMVIFEGSISRKVFSHLIPKEDHRTHNSLIFGMGKICAFTMFVYLFLKAMAFLHSQEWHYLLTGFGAWYLFELVGLVVIPMIMFIASFRNRNAALARVASILTLVGIIVNRLNVTVIGFNWDAAVRYVPTWMEIVVTMAVISIEIWVFRWIVNRLPVFKSTEKTVEIPPIAESARS